MKIPMESLDAAFYMFSERMRSREATVMLLAIGLQESLFEHRRQIGGPARGFWQFELGGAVRGVLTHPASRKLAQDVCRTRGVPAIASAVYAAIEHDDVLAAAFARLLLWTDPDPLPAVGEVAKAWDLYLRTWNPGKPHRETWDGFYAQAMDEVMDDRLAG